MSLGKRYYVECESRSLVLRIDQGWLWPTLQISCQLVAPSNDTARQARSNARKLGWTRPLVRFAINRDTDTTARFDLCPKCTATIAKMLGDLPK